MQPTAKPAPPESFIPVFTVLPITRLDPRRTRRAVTLGAAVGAGPGTGKIVTTSHPQCYCDSPRTRWSAYVGDVRDDAPLDPFAGDPADPAASLSDPDEGLDPLTVDEREDVLADLEDLEVFQTLLEPR